MSPLLSMQENTDNHSFIMQLYQQHAGLMHSIAFRIVRDYHAAEDIVSAVMVDLIANIDRLSNVPHSGMRAYIAAAVRNESIDYVRRQNRQPFLLENENVLDAIADHCTIEKRVLQQTDNESLHQIDNESLHQILLRLPQNMQKLLTMKYAKKMPDHEIARVLNIAPNSVRMYLTRARTRMKIMIEKEKLKDDS